jgi:uncharacterized protein (TIGR02145 family)
MKNQILVLAAILSFIFSNSLNGQTIDLTFTGQDAETSEHVQLDSIFIRNITQETDTFLMWNDTTLTLDLLNGLPEEIIPDNSFELLQNYPNPFSDRTTFVIRVFEKDNFTITLCDIIGRKLAQFSGDFDRGAHLFTITASQNNFYLLNVVSSKKSQSIKLLNSNVSGISQYGIDYLGFQPIGVSNKIIKSLKLVGFPFNLGDEMQYVGFASGYQLPAIYDSPEANSLYTFQFEKPDTLICGQPFIDKRDGKTYQTVLIGNQCWMAENLNVGERIDGNENQQNNDEIEKYCYDNNVGNCSQFGGLYQWDELMKYDTNRYIQGICPQGWHLPTIDEWNTLIDSVGGSEVAGTNLKTGGSSGFNALLAGQRTTGGLFDGLSNETSFWSTDRQEDPFSYLVYLSQGSPAISLLPGERNAAYSVRCVKGLAPIIKPNVVIIDTSIYTLISDSLELSQGIYKYEYSNKRVTGDIVNSDIIVGQEYEGYLRRVKSVTDQPPILTLITSQANIEDVIEEGEFKIYPNYDTTAHKFAIPGKFKLPPSSGHFYNQITDLNIAFGPSFDITITDATFDFTIHDTIIIIISQGIIQKVDYHVYGEINTAIETHATIGNAIVDLMLSKNLIPIIYPPIPVPIPGTLFVFKLSAYIVLKGNVSSDIEGSIMTSIFTNDNFDYQILYEYGNWSFSKDNVEETGLNQMNIPSTINTTLKLSLGPQISFKLCGLLGPYFFAGGMTKATIACAGSPTYNRNADLTAGLEAALGFNIGVETPWFSWTPVKFDFVNIGYDWSLWRMPDQLLEISGNNQTGAPNQQLPQPVVVRVVDNLGNSILSVPVHFAIVQGGGSLSGNDFMTDADGYAQTLWTLGPEEGINLMTASVQKADGSNITGSPMEFSAIALGGLATVTTAPVTDTTETTATCGGDVLSDGGFPVSEKGVCWSTSPGPTLEDEFTIDGSGLGTFVSYLTGLSINTLYYVRAYATNSNGTSYGNEVPFITAGDTPPGEPCPGMPTVTYGGQVYNTVQIGTQCWLKEDLNIGTRINGSQNQQNNGIIEKYCYDDLESNCDIYGGLYQWDEVMQYVSTEGTQGICPDGWHIPTDAEWTILTNYLGGENVAGGKMKEAGLTHWASPNTGATNESGFTALPGGTRQENGIFGFLTYQAYFWSSSQNDDTYAWYRQLICLYEHVSRSDITKARGFSARCVQD